jgi:hypothetical protein
MVSATDGWAVGQSAGPLSTGLESWQPLVMRWTGAQWVTADLPHVDGGNATLEAVFVRASDDVWAVGHQADSALVMHFDGTRWARIGVPRGGASGTDDALLAVNAVAAGDVWAVGTTCVWVQDPGFVSCQPLALRLSGGAWQVVPTAGDGGTHLVDVVARSAGDVWVVGYDGPPGRQEANHVEHWDGLGFTTVPTMSGFSTQSGLASALEAVARIPGTAELWAVGWQGAQAQVIRHG